MILRVVALLVFFTVGIVSAHAEGVNDSVRVRLLHLSLPITIDGSSLQVTDLDKSGMKSVSIPRNESLTIDRKIVGGEKIWILKKGDKIVRTSRPFIEIQSLNPRVHVSGYELPTPLIVSARGRNASADVVAALKLDDYLEGVLAGEMPASWPLEALKAQAVAARTYTLYQMQERSREPYQLEGSVLDQVYSLDLPEAQRAKIRQAIQETADDVLTQNKKLIKAFYHSDCGGQTEDPSLVWGGTGAGASKAGPIIDEGCAFSPIGKWQFEISLDELRGKLDSSGEKLFGDLKSVKVASRTPSQRAALLAFNDGEKDMIVTGNKLREILGYKKLKSTLFTVVQNKETVTFNGRGFGHGSGLCQWGARSMAQKGHSVREILKHYYPSAHLTEINVANR